MIIRHRNIYVQCALNSKNEFVSIDEVDSGLACDCHCPACNQSFVAKKGNIRVYHFAHANGADCDGVIEATFKIIINKIIFEEFSKLPVFCDYYTGASLLDYGHIIEIRCFNDEEREIFGFEVLTNTGKNALLLPTTHFDDVKISKALAIAMEKGVDLLIFEADFYSNVSLNIDIIKPQVFKDGSIRLYFSHDTFKMFKTFESKRIRRTLLENLLNRYASTLGKDSVQNEFASHCRNCEKFKKYMKIEACFCEHECAYIGEINLYFNRLCDSEIANQIQKEIRSKLVDMLVRNNLPYTNVKYEISSRKNDGEDGYITILANPNYDNFYVLFSDKETAESSAISSKYYPHVGFVNDYGEITSSGCGVIFKITKRLFNYVIKYFGYSKRSVFIDNKVVEAFIIGDTII